MNTVFGHKATYHLWIKQRVVFLLLFVLFFLNVSAQDKRPLIEDSIYQTRKKFDYFFLEALRLKENDKHSDAYATLEYALRIDSTSSSALSLLANYYLFLQQDSLAVDAFQKTVKYSPQTLEYKVALAEIYRETGNITEATLLYEDLVAIQSSKPELNYYLSDLYTRQNQIDKAIQSLDALENTIGTNEALSMQKIRLYLRTGQMENALNELNKLVTKYPAEVKYQMLVGDFFLENNMLEEARLQFQMVTEANPENLPAWRLLMNIAIKEENTDEIINVCNKALSIFPGNPEFYFYKGSAYYQLKNYQESLAVFQEGIQFVPVDDKILLSTFHGQIGDLFHHLSKKEESYMSYDKALQYNENNIFVLNNYAYFLSLDKQDLDKAELMSGRTLRMQPNNPTYIDTYAWIFFQKENYSMAKFYIESAISNGGDKSPDILEHYGDILFKTGNADKAVEQWEKALKAKEEGENTALLKKKIENKMYYDKE